MLIFISYSRVNEAICHQIVDHLPHHRIWFDNMLVAVDDWWDQITRMIDYCQVFVNLVSPSSLKSVHCNDEYDIALSKKLIIINVLVEPVETLPATIDEKHYIDMTAGLTTRSLAKLNEALEHARVMSRRRWPQPTGGGTSVKPMAAPPAPPVSRSRNEHLIILRSALQAVNEHRYEDALITLNQLNAVTVESDSWTYNKREIIRAMATQGLKQAQLREAEERKRRMYELIVEFLKNPITRMEGVDMFRTFYRAHNDYDPLGIAARLWPKRANGTHRAATTITTPLPLLEFKPVSGGEVLLKIGSRSVNGDFQTVTVEDFYMAQYPFTNDQARQWYSDPNGYANHDWWNYSPFAQEWRRMNPNPTEALPGFDGPFLPRANVTWYEALALCAYLSAQLGFTITLPTRAQRVRAARGNTDRTFPWIGEFSVSHANTEECRIARTTDVTMYELGASSFSSVWDLVGNTWEWCLDTENGDVDITTNQPRVMHGGSYKSPTERAKLDFFYCIPPNNLADNIGFRVVTTHKPR